MASLYQKRRERILRAAGGKQVAAATPDNMFYLTGFWGGGVGIVGPDETLIITSALESDRAREVGHDVDVVNAKTWAEVTSAVAKKAGRGEVLIDDDRDFRKLKRFKLAPRLFLEARRVKDPEEVGRIRKASQGIDGIFRRLESELKPGRTEREVAAEVMKLATLSGLTPSGSNSSLSPTIVASGENGALPHGEVTDRKLRAGDFVVADLFFRFDGYNSDETRTFAVGSATAGMKRHYAAVLEAQEEALEMVAEGSRCAEINARAVKVLRKHGVAKYLNHSIGHGVGIDIHELPNISAVSQDELGRYDVVTDEPGIYILGKYGIRIEDTVLVDRGAKVLTRYPKELVTVG